MPLLHRVPLISLMAMEESVNLEQYRNYLRVLADMQLNQRLPAKEDLSDVVQITLLQAHRDQSDFRGQLEGELRSWLKTIFTHTLINLTKKYQARKRDLRIERSIDQQMQESAIRIVGGPSADQTSPSEHVMRQERAEHLADAMSLLLADECEAVMLKHVHDWKVAEIAEHRGRSLEGVAGLLRRGLKKLRKSMPESEDHG